MVGIRRTREVPSSSGSQRRLVGKPGSPVMTAVCFLEELRRPDPQCRWFVFGLGDDRPTKYPTLAEADQRFAIGLEQHGLAKADVKLGQLKTVGRLPDANAGIIAGRQELAVWADVDPLASRFPPSLGAVAVERRVD